VTIIHSFLFCHLFLPSRKFIQNDLSSIIGNFLKPSCKNFFFSFGILLKIPFITGYLSKDWSIDQKSLLLLCLGHSDKSIDYQGIFATNLSDYHGWLNLLSFFSLKITFYSSLILLTHFFILSWIITHFADLETIFLMILFVSSCNCISVNSNFSS